MVEGKRIEGKGKGKAKGGQTKAKEGLIVEGPVGRYSELRPRRFITSTLDCTTVAE